MPPPQGTPNPLEGPGDYTVTKTVHSDTYAAIDPAKINHTGHAVFITGGSRGIGKAIALSFAKAGASFIAVTGRKPPVALVSELEAAAKAAGRSVPHVLPIALEVTDQLAVKEAAALVEKEFGRIDVVVNNAGMFGGGPKIADSDPEEWWQIMDVNLRGPFLVAKYFVPLLLKSSDGVRTIVNVSSVGAHLTNAGRSSYQTSKLSLIRLMEHVTNEYRDDGLVAFSVHPGNIPTDIIGGLEGLPDFLKPVFVDTAELPADTITFLTKENQAWLGGRYINCTWDMPELLAQKEEIVEKDKLKVKLVI